ncbi:flagellar biosynthetic protein FliO [Caldinitratiruptor microaerophilus]|uniref:Flagellar protein n=1 Tax=Caldinitratiruptor microaerophilus TaxID=671077 RepID=A0AA35CL88_9FIRM|nr:flagellar biosynthetic protein FliO [Caldinitratiruptor microaerophilus]BDG59365.1 hypothetical protein caldi_04550 [Caldinitratiruptor microaerophilus]
MEIVIQIATFLLLFLLVVAAAYLASRALAGGAGRVGGGRLLRVVEALPVGRDRLLVLVEVGDRYLLVGSAPGGVSLVQVLEGDAARELAGRLRAGPAGTLSPDAFRRLLDRWLRRGGPGEGTP